MSQIIPTAAASLNARSGRRAARKPKHSFHVRQAPFDIQPVFAAPVLPGETMKSAVLQARGYSKPITNPIIGWWTEYYFFYVRLRDMRPGDDRDNVKLIENLFLNYQASISGLIDDTAYAGLYHAGSVGGSGQAIPWLKLGYERIVKEYFRDGNEALGTAGMDGIYRATMRGNSWIDSLDLSSNIPEVLIDQTPTADIELSELDEAYRTWLALQAEKYIEMDFADYLRMNGVRPRAEDEQRPELIYYTSDWQYPTNTINPSDVLDAEDEVVVPAGQPSAALSWSTNVAATKNRYFREPGIIVGISLVRPKMYRDITASPGEGINSQPGQALDHLNHMKDWLPGMMAADPYASLQKQAAGAGPLEQNSAAEYVWDARDLFLYGDQFVALDGNSDPYNATNTYLGSGNNGIKYPSAAAINGLFVDGAMAAGLKQDGVVDLSILSYESKDAT